MPPLAVAVAGLSGAGKTSLLERLVPRLSEQGVRVGYLKANAHRIDLDREGKDTERLRRAGASTAGIVGRQGGAFFRSRLPGLFEHSLDPFHDPQPPGDRDGGSPSDPGAVAPPDEWADLCTRTLLWNLRGCFEDCDLLLIEGMKASPLPKILMNREDNPRGTVPKNALRNVVLHLRWPALPTDWSAPLLEAMKILHSMLRAPARIQARGVVGGVLAGGSASRMGEDKARIRLFAKLSHDAHTTGEPADSGARSGTLLERAYLLLAERLEETWVIGRVARSASADLPGLCHPVLSHLDLRGSAGPLAGMETALAIADGRAVLVIPCDLPFLPGEVLDHLLSMRRTDASAVAYRNESGRPESAVLLLEARSRDPLREFLDNGGRRVGEFLQSIHTHWLPLPESWVPAFPDFNTPDDGRRWKANQSPSAGPDE